jgi:hypothetical protein
MVERHNGNRFTFIVANRNGRSEEIGVVQADFPRKNALCRQELRNPFEIELLLLGGSISTGRPVNPSSRMKNKPATNNRAASSRAKQALTRSE